MHKCVNAHTPFIHENYSRMKNRSKKKVIKWDKDQFISIKLSLDWIGKVRIAFSLQGARVFFMFLNENVCIENVEQAYKID